MSPDGQQIQPSAQGHGRSCSGTDGAHANAATESAANMTGAPRNDNDSFTDCIFISASIDSTNRVERLDERHDQKRNARLARAPSGASPAPKDTLRAQKCSATPAVNATPPPTNNAVDAWLRVAIC